MTVKFLADDDNADEDNADDDNADEDNADAHGLPGARRILR